MNVQFKALFFNQISYITSLFCFEGVKFIFDKIDVKRPEKEYSFTVRLDGDVCDCEYQVLHRNLVFN